MSEALAPGTRVGAYEIRDRIGGGGMGVVYRARDTRLDRDAALKFLPPELSRDTDAKRRFLQEAKAVSSLDHPNVCTIYEVGGEQRRLALHHAASDVVSVGAVHRLRVYRPR